MAKPARTDHLAKDVVRAALELHRARPWSFVPREAPLLLDVEPGEPPLVCFVSGEGGGDLGLELFRGATAVRQLEDRVADPGRHRCDRFGEAWWVSFQPRGEIPDPFGRLLDAAGLRVARDRSAPVVAALPAGQLFRPLSRPELRIVLAALRTVVAAVAAGSLSPRPWDPAKRRALELSLEGSGKSAKVRDRVVVVPTCDTRAASVELPGCRSGAFDDLPWRDATWTLIASAAEDSPDEDDPRQHELLTAIDDEEGLPVWVDFLPANDAHAVAACLAELFQGRGEARGLGAGLPRAVRLGERWLDEVLGDALRGLGIDVSVETDRTRLARLRELLQLATDQEQGDRPLPPGFLRWEQISRQAQGLLLERSDYGGLGRADRLQRYFGDAELGKALLDRDDPEAVEALIEWTLFDDRAAEGAPTCAEVVLAGDLSDELRTAIEARRDGSVSLYRVSEVDEGISFVVENLLLEGDRRLVHDELLSETLVEGDLAFLKLYQLDEWCLCVPAGPPLPAVLGGRALQAVRESGMVVDGGSIVGGREQLGRLWGQAERWDEAFSAVNLQNTDGDSLVPLVLRFRAARPGDVAAWLDTLSGVRAEEPGRWAWLEPRDRPAPGSLVHLGSLELFDDELVAKVNSRERAARLKELLASHDALTFEVEREEPADRPADDRPSGPPAYDAELDAAVREQLRRACLGWIDTPVPVLDGRTPREAWRDPELRPRVEDLVRAYPDSNGPWGTIPAPREELLRELRRG